MAYLAAAAVKTFNVVCGHSSIACLFKCDISYLWCVARSLCMCRASCSRYHDCFDFKMAAIRHLRFWKCGNFIVWYGPECRVASLCKISPKSVEILPRHRV